MAFLTAFATSVNDKLYANKSFSRTAISISSSGKPVIAICEMPCILRISFSIFLAYCFKVFKETPCPLTVKLIVGRKFSTFAITGGSNPTGNDGILSTAFFTSDKITSIFCPLKTSTVTTAEFSNETDVTLSTPTIPFKLSSILRTTPSSISAGEAPGYTKLMLINRESTSGKKDDFMDKIPTVPRMMNAKINTLTATEYFIKKVIIFFMLSRFLRLSQSFHQKLQKLVLKPIIHRFSIH